MVIPVATWFVVLLPAVSVTISHPVTRVRGAVPQLVSAPVTWNEPALRRILAGPQILPTVRQAVLVTTVVQGAELDVVGPHGPLPVTVNLSMLGPQLVTEMV